MDDLGFGSALRLLRIRQGLRQADVAVAAGVSRSAVSRLERGRMEELQFGAVRRIARALDARVDLVPRWRGGDLARLVNERHGAMHEAVATMFAAFPEWAVEPEVSFSIYGERGVIDVFCWHPGRRMLLVIELKTAIVDVNDLMGGVDRKRRLAREIARDHGWDPAGVSVWVIVAEGRTNRRHVSRHASVLRAKFPVDGRSVRDWLNDPVRPISALSFLPSAPGGAHHGSFATVRRVRAAARARRTAD